MVQLSVSQGAAHAGATDDLGTDVNGSHGVDREPQFAAQGSQERNIAATTLTKVESLTHGEAAETAESVDQIPDKGFTGLLAQQFVKAEYQYRVSTLSLDGGDALGQRLQESWGLVRPDHGQWVRIEGGHHRRRSSRPGIHLRLSDDMLMPEVDAIEKTQGQADSVGAEGLRGTQDGHRHQRTT